MSPESHRLTKDSTPKNHEIWFRTATVAELQGRNGFEVFTIQKQKLDYIRIRMDHPRIIWGRIGRTINDAFKTTHQSITDHHQPWLYGYTSILPSLYHQCWFNHLLEHCLLSTESFQGRSCTTIACLAADMLHHSGSHIPTNRVSA